MCCVDSAFLAVSPYPRQAHSRSPARTERAQNAVTGHAYRRSAPLPRTISRSRSEYDWMRFSAPWSVGSQGYANVSHGCTGMSTANAGWLYNITKRGDVVEYTGTDRAMEFTNGYGDWNESFAQYAQGSALS